MERIMSLVRAGRSSSNRFPTLFILLLVGLFLAACGTKPELLHARARQGTATVMLPGHEEPTAVTYDIIGDRAVIEGDIILGEVDTKGALVSNQTLHSQGVAREGNSFRWPLGVIPYRINNQVPRVGVQQILEAIAHWEVKTKIRFAPHSGQQDYVEFVLGIQPGYCSSYIGRRGGRQEIVLSPNGDCTTRVVIHEIGHAVGLWHEQAREDRESYVQVAYDNVISGQEHNFYQHVADGFDIGPYDYSSIMHYDCKAFSKNGLDTIRILRPTRTASCATLGKAAGLSSADILSAAYLHPSFYSLGGGLVGAPAVVSWGGVNSDYLAVFVRGTDNALWYRERLTSSKFSWSPWKSLGGRLTSDPAAVSWGLNRIDVFAKGANNQLIHRWLSGDPEPQWSSWESLGGTLNGAPAVSSRGYRKLDVFIRGNDNRLYQKSFAGSWGGWQNQGGQLTSAPASVSWNGSRIDVFARGSGNTLVHKWWDGAWHAWETLGSGLLSGPAVASWGQNRLDVFMRGAGDKIYHKIYNGRWTGWEYLEGYTLSDPEAIARGPNRLDVFVTGLDNALWHKGWDGN